MIDISQSYKYGRHDDRTGSWCDTDSVDTINDIRPFFKFKLGTKLTQGESMNSRNNTEYLLDITKLLQL